MKIIFYRSSFILILFCITTKIYGQNFSVITIASNKTKKSGAYDKTNESDEVYKIVFQNDTTDLTIASYSALIKKIKASKINEIEIIKELLRFKGDNRVCSIPIMCYNPEISAIHAGKEERYSIQIEALFIINQLYFDKPFNFSPYPIFYNSLLKKYTSIKGPSIKCMYTRYNKWMKKVEKCGLTEARAEHLEPRQTMTLMWYSSVYPWNIDN